MAIIFNNRLILAAKVLLSETYKGIVLPFIFECVLINGSEQILQGHHGRLLNFAQMRSPTSYFSGVAFFLG